MAVTVTVAGSGAQSVPYSSVQPPAGWQSLQIPVTNTGADWMVAVVTWRQSAASAGIAVHVGDDTLSNFWTPLGAPAGTSSAAGVTRVAIWTAPAAYAAKYVLAAPSSLTPGTAPLGLACTVLNVHGLLPWQTLTGITTNFANATALPALTQGAPATQALLITGCGSDVDTDTISLAGTGWTSLAQVSASNGTDHTADIVLNGAYQVTTGSTSATWSSAGAQDLCGVLAGLLVSGTAPAPASPAWPVTVCELALGAQSHTPADQLTWTAVTGRSLNLQNLTQGAQYNLAALSAAQGVMTFDNPDAELIAPGTGSFAGIASGTPFRIRQIWQGGSWQVQFNGNGSTANPQILSSPKSPVAANASCSFPVWLAASAAWSGGAHVNLIWFTSGGTQISVTTQALAAIPQTATLVTVAGTAPSNAATAQISLTALGTPPATTNFTAAAAPSGASPGTEQVIIPPAVTWATGGAATVTTLAPWQPDPNGPPVATPYGVPFSGYIRSWPQSWDADQLRGQSDATLTDAWAYCNGNLQPILLQEILNDAPYAYWPCTDATGSVQASNYAAGNSNPLDLVTSKYGTGGSTQAFGQNSTAILGAQGTLLLSSSVRSQSEAGMWGQTLSSPTQTVGTGYSLACTDGNYPPFSAGITAECWFQSIAPFPTTNAPYIMQLVNPAYQFAVQVAISLSTGTIGFDVVQRGANIGTGTISPANWSVMTSPAHVAITVTTTGWAAYLNGVQTATGTFSTAIYVRALATAYLCGGVSSVLNFGSAQGYSGYTGHYAIFPSVLSPERIMTHYLAGGIAMAGDPPDQRIERLLQGGSNYPGRRVILQDSGSLVTPCASCQDIGGQAASVSIQNIASSTPPAVLGVSPPGELFYLARGYTWNQPVQWVIGQNTWSGEIPYLGDLAVSYDPLRVINDVQLTQLDNLDIVTPQPPIGGTGGIDYVSQAQNGDQPYWVTGYLENDLLSTLTAGPGLVDAANWVGGVNANPSNRVNAVTVDAASNPSAWPLFMTAAKGDMITVNVRPVTAPAGTVISVTGRISSTSRSLQWSLDGTAAKITLIIDLAAEQDVLTWDDPVKGQLNGENALAW